MDGFGDSFVPPAEGTTLTTEVDPAAEFLAREQDQLAGLGDDIIPATLGNDQPTLVAGLDGEADLFGGAPVNGGPDLESFEMLGGDEVPQEKAAPPPPPPPSVFGSVDFVPQPSGEDPWVSAQAPCPTDESVAQAVEDTLGFNEPLSSQPFTVGQGEGFLSTSDLAGAPAGAPAADAVTAEATPAEAAKAPEGHYTGFGAEFGGTSVPTGDAGTSSGAFSFVGESAPAAPTSEPDLARSPIPYVPREDPEKIKIWREAQRIRLEQKDAAEEVSKIELKEKAKKELEDWYKQHEEQVAKTRQANRSAEKELVADTAKMEPGTEWERITKLCNFNPKTSKSSRDISRMRSIILQVKQNPPIKA
ncbi:clathrin light chain isoform X2 [Procambarus clarkii]|uniref:clathrin light chain isoform X2 n=1 Tax=Procambarus clarkii TaxID=6728 RepID=UPI001E6711F4|nr:clathrin light chain-like isoform X2 [Procambarus clarkii]